jgi:hypothetical protein
MNGADVMDCLFCVSGQGRLTRRPTHVTDFPSHNGRSFYRQSQPLNRVSATIKNLSRTFCYIFYCIGHVVQLVEALLYKPEGRGFVSRRCHWNFSLT